jgi:hypothetical protein
MNKAAEYLIKCAVSDLAGQYKKMGLSEAELMQHELSRRQREKEMYGTDTLHSRNVQAIRGSLASNFGPQKIRTPKYSTSGSWTPSFKGLPKLQPGQF